MTIASTITALAAALGTVPSLQSTYSYPPHSVPAASLPAAIILADAGETQWQAVGYRRSERRYIILLLLAPLTLSRPQERAADVHALIDACIAELMDDSTLGGNVDHIARISDGGAEAVEVGDATYTGARLEVAVIEKW